jgi:hypothetical protein
MNGVRVLLVAVAVGSVEVISWHVRRHASHFPAARLAE